MQTEVQALTRNVRMSTTKLLDIARVIQGKPVIEVIDMLSLIPRKSATLILKTLKSAVANAENNNNMSAKDLIVQRAAIENASSLRRFRPAPRGMAHPYRRYSSHIRIIVAEKSK